MAIGDRSVVSANWADCGLGRDVVEAIRNLAERHEICRIILFGSRARGDFHKESDIDLAVSGGNFGMFSLDVGELIPTLLHFDFVNMDEPMTEKLRVAIETEGRVLYEKVANFKASLSAFRKAYGEDLLA